MPVYDPTQGYLPTYTPASQTTGGTLPSLPFGQGGTGSPPVVPPVTGGGGGGGAGAGAGRGGTRDERISRVMRMLRDPVYRALLERELGLREPERRAGLNR